MSGESVIFPRFPADVSRGVLRALLSALLFLAPVLPVAAQTVDVIRGRVTGPDNEPLDGAAVLVTTVSGNVNRSARTDRAGRYTVTFPNGDGDYFVTINAVGFAPKRFEIKRVADEDVLLADAKLTRVGTVLDALKVTADRQKVSRTEAQQDVGGTEQTIANQNALPISSTTLPRWPRPSPECSSYRGRMVAPTASPSSALAPTRTRPPSTA